MTPCRHCTYLGKLCADVCSVLRPDSSKYHCNVTSCPVAQANLKSPLCRPRACRLHDHLTLPFTVLNCTTTCIHIEMYKAWCYIKFVHNYCDSLVAIRCLHLVWSSVHSHLVLIWAWIIFCLAPALVMDVIQLILGHCQSSLHAHL